MNSHLWDDEGGYLTIYNNDIFWRDDQASRQLTEHVEYKDGEKNVVHQNKAGYQLGDRYALAACILKTQDDRGNATSSYGSILEGGYDGMVVVQRTTFWYDHVACYNMRNGSLVGLALLGAVFHALVRNSTRWRQGRSKQFRSIVRKATKWRMDSLLRRL